MGQLNTFDIHDSLFDVLRFNSIHSLFDIHIP